VFFKEIAVYVVALFRQAGFENIFRCDGTAVP
jgi:hypothetical protein